MKKLNRRHFLRGAGGAALALPFLGAMSETASAAPFPKRFIAFFTGLGQVKSAWSPTGTETDFTLSPVLTPLTKHQSKLLVMEGIDMESAYHGPGDPHQQGIAQSLSATELQVGNLFPYACNPEAMVGWGGGISVDQRLANQLGQKTKFPSLELGVQVQYTNVSSRFAYKGAAQPVPPEDSPYQLWDRLFSDLTGDPQEKARLRMQRRKVLAAVMDDAKSLTGRLGADDKQKLEHHLEAVSSIATRLDAPGEIGGVCAVPDVGGEIDIYANENYPLIGKLQMDLLAMSLACDLTRVASLQWTSTQTGKVFSWLGQSETHHGLSHSGLTDEARQNQLVAIGNWHAKQLAYLMDKLASFPEGDGTVLDNTLILWCTDIAQGQSHARRDMPYVLAGGAGGALKMGRYLKYGGDHHNNLLVSILNAMGVPDTTFGNPAYCTGALPRLIG
jgi:Protein of unknown function (DUF1552)